MVSKAQLTSTSPSTRMKPPLMSRVSWDRVSMPVPVTMAAVVLTTLPRKAPTLESVRPSGSSGAAWLARASLAATTTCLPIWARSRGEKISCSRPVEEASSTRAVRSLTYSSSGRAHSFSRARSKASPTTSCRAASSSLRRSMPAAEVSRSSRSPAARRPRSRMDARSRSAWARASASAAWAWAPASSCTRRTSSRASWAILAVIFSIPSIKTSPLSGRLKC